MAYASIGLKSHIWNNNLRSLFLLAMFPMLFIIMLWSGGFLVQALETHQQTQQINYGLAIQTADTFTRNYALYVFIGISVWFVIAWLFNQNMINKSTGAKPLERKDNPEIYNLMENLCISKGIIIPKLFIIESDALNAYASGINDRTYSVTLTTGLIKKLNKEELEGVIAHELTHIVNKDVRLLIISIIFVGIISFLAETAFRSLLRSGHRRRNSNSKGNGGIIILIALAVLVIGYIFALLIRFSLSRKREYLADAGAVELTKNPTALASALQKISGHAKMEDVPGEVEQMFIENPPMFNFMHTGIFSIFATHPPIQKRIEILRALT
jgi:heat shock protein HtpX